MTRQRKIALIGARGYKLQSAEVKVSSYPWDHLDEIANLRDFDTVILDLLSVPSTVDWNRFTEILNIYTMNDIVKVGGGIIVIGDSRFRVTGNDLDQPFLDWTVIRFTWDDQPGDTIERSQDWPHKSFLGYLEYLKHWDYALRHCALHQETLRHLLDPELMKKMGRRIRLE